ncbi:MAG: AzlC family ABC transporter permease [Oscillospiraceae bacterium]|jgi:predicted branched-subunit amino acid permease
MDEAETMSPARTGLGHGTALREGIRDGLPIALGYFAVSFTLGIAAKRAGLTAVQGFFASLLCNASAGEYAGFTLISASAALWELALMTLVVNARYLLMSTALSQKFAPDTPFFHRFIVGFDVTDELFGIAIARPGYLDPWYFYGAMLVAMPGWACGTFLGVLAGNLLPVRLVSALSVALYGMFLAVIVPPARKDKVVAALLPLCFFASWAAAKLPGIAALSAGTRTIFLTLVIAGAAALFFPVQEETEDADEA